ncbi:hypothetical protein Fot_38483 [Forsythia ovata]|uniref:Uncharacterized protein n=1 Tax=Forsythia ovata TaxID=205694 RepID=A0ABD1S1Z2_9LAMI
MAGTVAKRTAMKDGEIVWRGRKMSENGKKNGEEEAVCARQCDLHSRTMLLDCISNTNTSSGALCLQDPAYRLCMTNGLTFPPNGQKLATLAGQVLLEHGKFQLEQKSTREKYQVLLKHGEFQLER